MTLTLQTKLLITPVHRPFTLDDRRIQNAFADPERVSSFENFVYAGIVPFGLLFVWAAAVRPGFHQAHVTILGFLISVAMSSFLTHVFKNAIGRARPDLIARCMPERGTPANELIDYHVCTQTDLSKLNDGWRSFPSGHSSFAFSGLGYLSFLLAGQLHSMRPRADLARVLITIAPLIGAFMVAASRTADYRHDIYDVTAGSLLGLLMAYFGYRRYYRSLWDPQCHVPYPSPADDQSEERHLFTPKRTDEEQPLRSESFDLGDMSEEEEARPLSAGTKGKQRQDSR